MKRFKHKKLITLIVALMLGVAMIASASFAWFTATDSVTNHLSTKGSTISGVSILESFVPPKDWQPDQTITKVVGVANTGDNPAVVRLSLQEDLTVNAPGAETTPITQTKVTADPPVLPQIVDMSSFTGTPAALGDFVLYAGPVTDTTAHLADFSANGGLVIDGWDSTYANIDFYVAYVPADIDAITGVVNSPASWSIAAAYKIPAAVTDYAGQYQAVIFDATSPSAWDTSDPAAPTVTPLIPQGYPNAGDPGVLYGIYTQKTADVDWTTAKPTVTVNDATKTAVVTARAEALLGATDPNYDNGYITINLVNITSTPMVGFWYYNATDGWFYYIDTLDGGVTTPNLIDSLHLDADANNYYANMDFNLTVNMNATQPTLSALISDFALLHGATDQPYTTYAAAAPAGVGLS